MTKRTRATAICVLLLLSITGAASPEANVIEAVIHPPKSSWVIVFARDGAVRAIGRAEPPVVVGRLPAGAVHFEALVSALVSLRTEEKVDGGTDAGLRRDGDENVKGFYLRDDALPRYLEASFRHRWESEDPRFREVLDRHPMYPAAPRRTSGERPD